MLRAILPLAALAVVAGGIAGALSGGDARGGPRAGGAPPTARDDEADRRSLRRGGRGGDVREARCPRDSSGCEAVTGRVIYVEAVDPDGDGDAHYVLAGGSVTAPGVTVVDVRRGLRPRRLPRAGDVVSAAGPVHRGSYGQAQIEAVEVRHRRR